MTDSLALVLREHVIAYLVDEVSLRDFQDRLVGATWDIEDRGDPHATDMAYEIKLALAEHSQGDISLQELREQLGDLVATVNVANTGANEGIVVTLDTTSTSVTAELELQTVHTLFAVASW
jgi:hypothetical protein